MKTRRTNSTTKVREDSTLKKVVSVETWFGRKIDPGHSVGEGDTITEKGARQTNTAKFTGKTNP